ncbi:hypothetical protein Acsp06_56850 [Actinomycetospora sp. NBRC 106375]|uniref:PH domain-containing protein n=1 Tax=Actinomycetospora sp. NBRC 106375 TaxID=3032207 RepID=UPI0024A237FB|nr:PH domain-containing protein [Actinomycetospora sp. NBRC 106375]GLZ49500.1 hypothetical protein Acsp06_56850 [Actinomycetospora sp. NBRC 106375]
MAYPDGVLRRGEHVLAHRRPHWRMLVVPALVPPAAVFLAALLAGLADAVPAGSTRTALRLALVLLAVVAIGWLAVLPLVRWRCTHLVVTDRRVLVREGVLTRESVDVGGATITGVRTRRTALERVLGAGTLVVATAGADEPWEFAGLGDVDTLARLVEGMAEDRGGLDRAATGSSLLVRSDGGTWDDEDPGDEDDELDEDADPGEDPPPRRGLAGRFRRGSWRGRRPRAARTSR